MPRKRWASPISRSNKAPCRAARCGSCVHTYSQRRPSSQERSLPISEENYGSRNSKRSFLRLKVIENDLKKARIALSDVKLIIFDEAHRAVGNYAYRFIASKYVEQAPDPLILGMTASPGGTVEKIHEVSENLFIDNIEIRTESDPDVYPYTHEKNVEARKLSLPAQMETIQQNLKQAASQRLRQLMKLKVVFSEWVSTVRIDQKYSTKSPPIGTTERCLWLLR